MTMKFVGLENEGRFEGYVGQDPEIFINSRDAKQALLHVGQTPVLKEKGEKDKRLKTIWIRFACFGPLAEFVANNVSKGMRVEVKYRLSAMYHPIFKNHHGFEARLVRPIRRALKKDGEFGSFEERWRPESPKGGKYWGGDYEKWSKPELTAEAESRGLVVEGSGRAGRVLCDDLRTALDLDDKAREEEEEDGAVA